MENPRVRNRSIRATVWYRVIGTVGGIFLIGDGGYVIARGQGLGWVTLAGGSVCVISNLLSAIQARRKVS